MTSIRKPVDRIYLTSRQAREARAFNDAPFSSTSRASYKPHDVISILKEERAEYDKNKGKARHAGEWWDKSNDPRLPSSSQPNKHAETIYRDSFKSQDYAKWLRSVANVPVAGNKSAPNDGAAPTGPSVAAAAAANPLAKRQVVKPATAPGDFMKDWGQHRVRKQVSGEDSGRYDIITGSRLLSSSQSIRPLRMSYDKVENGRDRSYDIISNVKLVPLPSQEADVQG
ncbi:uncharacterized protein EV422DRAFT_159317 [Fimicolochytrium jonesii]|uniref:uncharacterized protein n=1 Tax=Fimicolochytrium jonesii TaxID=1396493 RepID=UPI0022FE7DE9|nr:uncharacterized protein EV422DRAFT_159317 [Fimicolochytrium jonesii]KAI8826244.1 hypothetical protein EV422DRAFT_159317 [Fimicolochytrium jonesii]